MKIKIRNLCIFVTTYLIQSNAFARYYEDSDGGDFILWIPIVLAGVLGVRFGKRGAVFGAVLGLSICIFFPEFAYFLISLAIAAFGIIACYESYESRDFSEGTAYLFFMGIPGIFFTLFILKSGFFPNKSVSRKRR